MQNKSTVPSPPFHYATKQRTANESPRISLSRERAACSHALKEESLVGERQVLRAPNMAEMKRNAQKMSVKACGVLLLLLSVVQGQNSTKGVDIFVEEDEEETTTTTQRIVNGVVANDTCAPFACEVRNVYTDKASQYAPAPIKYLWLDCVRRKRCVFLSESVLKFLYSTTFFPHAP